MKLSVLVASYGEQSQKFIDLCYKSLQAQSFQDFEIIHVSSGDFVPEIPSIRTQQFHSFERMHYPEAIAKAYSISDKSSEYIFLLNDDVILDHKCLENMIDLSDKSNVIANPMSSCQNGRWYQAPLGFFKDDKLNIYLKNHFSYEEMAPNVDHIINNSLIHSPMFFYTNMVCFFATIMRRSTWDLIGGIDTKFQTGFDDQDFTLRAREIGIPCGIITSASVFHFSGASADLHLTQENRDFNANYFNEKHGRPK